MPSIYVLYADYDADEGCSSPEGIAYTEEEAQKWANKEPHSHTYAEFDIEVDRIVQ